MMRFTLGSNVKYYRKLKGLSQADLAEKVGVSTQFIKQIETNRDDPGMDTFAKISKVLEIPADYLLLETDRYFRNQALTRIFDELSELDDDDLNRILFIAQKVQEYKLEKEELDKTDLGSLPEGDNE